MIKIKNLCKGFYGKEVLDNIDLEIEEGKMTTLLGENGSGKSTLLKIISGYELPDSGSVEYKGEPLKQFAAITFAKRALKGEKYRSFFRQSKGIMHPDVIQAESDFEKSLSAYK